jgi:Leucine-rich repeat (LRR) protein
MISEAEMRMEAALTNDDSTLNLAGLGLDTLPEGARRLSQVRDLNLARNNLTAIPDWLNEFSSLTRLNLAGNRLQDLPNWLGNLTNLVQLSLTGNRLTELPTTTGNLIRLRGLHLARNGLLQLPEDIGDLAALEDLDLSGNQLRGLPESIGELSVLTDLDASRNRLMELPDRIGDMSSLMHLHLAHNFLTRIPEGIGNLSSLTRLDLTGNRLSRLPDGIGGLSSLTRLDLTGNCLAELADGIGDLSGLTRLDLARNELTDLPEALGSLASLTSLNLSGNRLRSLSPHIGRLAALRDLSVADNTLTSLPAELGDLAVLMDFDASGNRLRELSARIGEMRLLAHIDCSDNLLTKLPISLCNLPVLVNLHLANNRIEALPECVANLHSLKEFDLRDNRLSTLPPAVGDLEDTNFVLTGNPLAPELRAAYDQSASELKSFLKLLQQDGHFIHEAKLVLVGEGAAGKSSLLAAMRGEEWVADRPTTHGVEIKPIALTFDGRELTLNGWDFGGQRVYRPTHQFFFSAPAIYLVVWNPRVGPERHFVEYWMDLIKHRAGEGARILVVATHGGPAERNAFLDEDGLRSKYGSMIAGFRHVDSESRTGIPELLDSVAAATFGLQHVGRWYPAAWRRLREEVASSGSPYLSYRDYELLAARYGLTPTSARSLVRISNALGHWISHSEDPRPDDLVILKPDWLSTAISLVLDDVETIRANGLLVHARLRQLWDDPRRDAGDRYPSAVHPVFLQLMERFDISYRLSDRDAQDAPSMSLVTQLVPAGRPSLTAWDTYRPELDARSQTVEIVDSVTGDPVEPEGLMYQLIVRFHRFSLGRSDYKAGVHWQSGMILDDGYNGRALVSIERNRVFVHVRAAYPQFFLHRITEDVQEHVRTFWKGLSVRIMVPCDSGCNGLGLFDISKLRLSGEMGRQDYPCPQCPKWLSIDQLLLGVPLPESREEDRLVSAVRAATAPGIAQVIDAVMAQGEVVLRNVDKQGIEIQRAFSQAEERYRNLILALDDEARDGPRLFSVKTLKESVLRGGLIEDRVQITLYCEHSRLPVNLLDEPRSDRGVYHIKVPRKWLVNAAPWIRAMSVMVRSLLPVSLAALELDLSDTRWKSLNEQLQLAEASINALAELGADVHAPRDAGQDTVAAATADESTAAGSVLRSLHAFLREEDPTFGGLERVRDRNRYRWVHPRFIELYSPPPPDVSGAERSVR